MEIHHMSIADREAQIQRRKEQRTQMDRATSQKVKEVLKSTPLYVAIEKKYHDEYEQPALEQRKKLLADIRSFCRPLEKKELETHTLEYKLLKK